MAVDLLAAGAGDSLAHMVAGGHRRIGRPSRVWSVQRAGDEVEAHERSLFGHEVSSGSHGASVVGVGWLDASAEQMILRISTS
jgi:hypothetical protein